MPGITDPAVCLKNDISIVSGSYLPAVRKKQRKGHFTDDDPEQPRTGEDHEEREQEEIELLLANDLV